MTLSTSIGHGFGTTCLDVAYFPHCSSSIVCPTCHEPIECKDAFPLFLTSMPQPHLSSHPPPISTSQPGSPIADIDLTSCNDMMRLLLLPLNLERGTMLILVNQITWHLPLLYGGSRGECMCTSILRGRISYYYRADVMDYRRKGTAFVTRMCSWEENMCYSTSCVQRRVSFSLIYHSHNIVVDGHHHHMMQGI